MHAPDQDPHADGTTSDGTPSDETKSDDVPLTATEVDALRMLHAGRPGVAAAHATGLTLGSVARTAGALRSRYGTPSTVRALASARREGLI